jgi:hypothetical protein
MTVLVTWVPWLDILEPMKVVSRTGPVGVSVRSPQALAAFMSTFW